MRITVTMCVCVSFALGEWSRVSDVLALVKQSCDSSDSADSQRYLPGVCLPTNRPCAADPNGHCAVGSQRVDVAESNAPVSIAVLNYFEDEQYLQSSRLVRVEHGFQMEGTFLRIDALDYEMRASYEVTVEGLYVSTASEGCPLLPRTFARTVTVDVLDVDEPPVLQQDAYRLDAGDAVTVASVDPDAGSSNVYWLDSPSADCGLAVEEETGSLTWNPTSPLCVGQQRTLFAGRGDVFSTAAVTLVGHNRCAEGTLWDGTQCGVDPIAVCGTGTQWSGSQCRATELEYQIATLKSAVCCQKTMKEYHFKNAVSAWPRYTTSREVLAEVHVKTALDYQYHAPMDFRSCGGTDHCTPPDEAGG